MEHKHLIITIDTEGDNLWAWREGQPIGTENTRFLPPFQSLCEEYGMKPVYLSNYEMLQDPRFCAFARDRTGGSAKSGCTCMPGTARPWRKGCRPAPTAFPGRPI